MKFATWEPFYQKIVAEFGFDRAADESAARSLAAHLRPRASAIDAAWSGLSKRLGGRTVVVLGASDEARDELRGLSPAQPLVAADGATTAALEAGRVPDLIVSDLDGDLPDEVLAVERGAHIAVHAHGDNVAAIQEWLPRFGAARVLGTCQSRPDPPLRNYGGFTDGDRACFIAAGLGAARLQLAGFRAPGKPGRYSGGFDPAQKARKLAWAARLIDELGATEVEVSRSPSQAIAGTPPAPRSSAPSEGTGPRRDAAAGSAAKARRPARRSS